MNRRSWLAGFLLCALALPAVAADLNSAKSEGLIGEREDGYLGFVVTEPGSDVVALVEDVNAKRKAQYARIAAKNGIQTAQVEALAGKKAMEKTAPGGYVFSGGRWVRK